MQGVHAHTDLNKKLQGRDGVARAGTLADFGALSRDGPTPQQGSSNSVVGQISRIQLTHHIEVLDHETCPLFSG